jgi:hypothetical protein
MDMLGCLDADIKHGPSHTAWTWTCNIDMAIQHEHGNAACTGTCRMDMNMHHVSLSVVLPYKKNWPNIL